jgi:hypothetical protein
LRANERSFISTVIRTINIVFTRKAFAHTRLQGNSPETTRNSCFILKFATGQFQERRSSTSTKSNFEDEIIKHQRSLAIRAPGIVDPASKSRVLKTSECKLKDRASLEQTRFNSKDKQCFYVNLAFLTLRQHVNPRIIVGSKTKHLNEISTYRDF